MATTFSWSDTFHIAFSTCLPCFVKPANPGSSSSTDSLNDPTVAHRIPRARADELQGLLADSDAEAERMSLHSNPGRQKKRTKRKKDKRITLFGYDLFGHAPPPIQLPESDDEDGNRGIGAPITPTRSSSLTFDSDAAPIDSSTIASASAAALRAREEADETERREKAERRERRRQRKELKKAAKALALAEQGEDFEGFQGSGSGLHPEDYGPFVRAGPRENDEDIDEDVDLDGGVYARRSNTGTGSGSGSDSRSRTSASRSQLSQSDQPFPQQRLQPPVITGPVVPRSKKSKSKSSSTSRSTTSRASRSNTSTSTYQSPSLLSPASPTFYESELPSKSKLIIAEDFDGSQGILEADLPSPNIRGGFSSPGLRGGFPSPGLTEFPSSGFRSNDIERRDSLLVKGGAFLAIRGGVDEG
ncbi:hypothetical protein J132_05427 [Termitomyces sp. J132]|nr:hypothetical protein H2248_011305 [Termitomyces sp. 'cryptogamus']KNZ77469.1 hypothetical protein J132_05427 [Termitomyces sp. J132]